MSDAEFPWIAKELSWLSFNERVLQEAADTSVPIIQRVRYLGIFSNNLDEFFRVRVADVRRLATFSPPSKQQEYRDLLEDIRDRVLELQDRFEITYHAILKTLRKHKIYLVHEGQLDEAQIHFCKKYFIEHIQPELVPIMLDDSNPMPELNDASIYLGVRLELEDGIRYALIEIPTTRLPRFVRIPQKGKRRGKVLIVLENIIRVSLEEAFRGIFTLKSAQAYTIKLTRDAELELGEEITESFFEKMSAGIKRRAKGDPVRFVYDEDMPEDFVQMLNRRVGLGKLDAIIPGGRYHNSKDFMSFPNLGPAYLEMKPLSVLPLPDVDDDPNIFSAIRDRDVLLYYPYHSFAYVERMLKTAAIDPAVKSIKISLYRVASNSHVVDALLNAVANHKQVTAIVELQARFDEQANIELASRLTDSGVDVIFGVPGLKVHSKLILIGRQEGNVIRYYSHIGTGNFNEKTARIYTDFSLLTYDQSIGDEVAKAFDFIQYTYRRHDFNQLAVSPLNSRSRLLKMIQREIEHQQAGRPAGILLKCNNLVDTELVAKLYEASQVGVHSRLIVRGMCSLVPGVKGISDNIEGISIVDRFLEHPRVYVFENGGSPEYFISSADLMTRNLDFRVEVMCPILDEGHQQTIKTVLEIQWADNMKARVLEAEQKNKLRPRKKNTRKVRSQEVIHHYLATGKTPRLPVPASKVVKPKSRRRKKKT